MSGYIIYLFFCINKHTLTASKLIKESTAFEAAILSAAFACFLNWVLQAVVVTVYAVYARIVPSVTKA